MPTNSTTLRHPSCSSSLPKQQRRPPALCEYLRRLRAHGDYPATVIAAVGGDSSKYGTPVWDVPEGARIRYYWTTFSDGKHDTSWQEYEIDGNVLNLDNWHKTEKHIEITYNLLRTFTAA